MMTQALLKLLWYRLRGATLVKIRSLLNVRGVVLLCVILMFVGIAYQVMNEYADSVLLLEGWGKHWQVSELIPLTLFIACFSTVIAGSRQSLSYSSAEIDILFTAPINRSSLVAYKYIAYAFSSLLSAIFIAILLPSLNKTFTFSVVSLFLTLLFVQTATTTLNLIMQLVQRYFGRHEKKAWIYANITLISLIVYFVLQRDESCPGNGSAFVNCPVLSEILIVFRPIAEIYTETSVNNIVFNMSLVLLMIVVMFFMIISLERMLRDELYVQNLSSIANWNTMKKTGLLYRANVLSAVSRTAPKHWGASITLAWVQLLAVARNSKNTLLFFAVVALALGLVVPRIQSVEVLSVVYPMLYFLAVFVLPRFLVFDFRGSLELMESLRALPTSPWAVCVGYLLVPVLLTSSIEFITVLAIGINAGMSPVGLFFLFCALIAFNTILYLSENLIFMLYPSRLVPVGRVDFDFLGRTLLEFIVKSLIIFAVFGFSVSAISWASRLGLATLVAPTIGFLVFVLLLLCLAGLLVRAFHRFDASRF